MCAVATQTLPFKTPSLRYHKATGQWRITLGGQDHYLGRDPKVARQRAHALLADYLAQGPTEIPDAADITLSELIGLYLNLAQSQGSVCLSLYGQLPQLATGFPTG